jgi:acyl-CoA synthetase (AMP-forming)/AMP-acid ligase II
MTDRPDSFREVLSPGESRAQDSEMPGHGNTPADGISGGGTAITCSTVESALLEHPKIVECVVLPRKRTDGGGEFVAFFVRSGTVTENELCTHLRKILGESVVGGFVELSGLPFTRDGEVDEAALLRLPVLGADLARHCEESLRSPPRRPCRPPSRRWHGGMT